MKTAERRGCHDGTCDGPFPAPEVPWVTRHAAHVEQIGTGRVGLYLGPGCALPDGRGRRHGCGGCGGAGGYALMDYRGWVQWLMDDIESGQYRALERDSTTGAYVLPTEMEDDSDEIPHRSTDLSQGQYFYWLGRDGEPRRFSGCGWWVRTSATRSHWTAE